MNEPGHHNTLEKAMYVLFTSYFRNNGRLWVPDHLHEIEGFDMRLAHWITNSIMCAAPYDDTIRKGTWLCAADEDHRGDHWGGLTFENRVTGMSVAESLGRSLQQEGMA